MTFEEWKKTELDKHWAGSMDPDGEEFAKDAWNYQQEQIAQLQARLESEEAHYIRLYERYRALEHEAIEIVDYADFPRPMKKDMDRIQKKSVDALRALIKREVK